MTTNTITTHDPSDPAEAVVATLRRDGAAVVANLVAPEAMDQLMADLRFGDETKAGNDFIGGSDNRSIGAVLHANPKLCETLLVNERVLEVADSILRPEQPMAASSAPMQREKARFATSDDGCAQVLSVASPPESGPYCHHYRVGASVSIEARNGGATQVLHREMAIYEPYVAHGPGSRDFILNMMWAGSDFTVANGATRLVPGSHLWPADRVANESQVAQAVMRKGSVLFWLCRTLHGLGACNSRTSRTGIFTRWSSTGSPRKRTSTSPSRPRRLRDYRSRHGSFSATVRAAPAAGSRATIRMTSWRQERADRWNETRCPTRTP